MRSSRPRAASKLLLLALALVFSAAAKTQEPGRAAAAIANPVETQSLDQLSTTLDRPLFSPSRRRPLAPSTLAVQAPALPAPPPDLVLFGVVMDGEGARAVVRAGADKRLLRAQIGDEIDGWKVAQIDGRKVVLASQDGRFATFRLFNNERGAAASGEAKNSEMRQVPPPASPPTLVQRGGRSRE
jgi:general secretion pathway protein N